MSTIEQSIIKGLLYDEAFARKTYPYLKSEFFESASREVFNLYSELFDKYNKIPTIESMVVSLQSKKLDETTFADSVDLLQSAYQDRGNLSDTDWLVDETEKYCVDRALFDAIYAAMSIIEGRTKDKDKHAIPEILEEALSISFDSSIGSDYFEDVEARYSYYTSTETRLPFPLKALNELSNGGLPPKTLSAFLAGSNVGKSALMCFLAGEWLKAGKNVLYITLEMSEEAIQERIDANLLDMTTDQLKSVDLNKEDFMNRIQKLKSRTTGKLIVKEYPTGAGHSGHFRHLMKELRQKKKFKPDVVFVDYINICSSARFKSGSNANSYTIVKSIAEELRGLAVEFEVPFVTATQTTREGMNSQSPDMTSTSESIGLPQTLDFFAAIVTNEELMEMNRQVMILLKTRFGNKSKAKSQIVKIDFDKMRYTDVEHDTNGAAQISNNVVKPDFANKKSKPGIPEGIKWD